MPSSPQARRWQVPLLIVLILAAGGILYWVLKPASTPSLRPSSVWFYDLSTGQKFTADAETMAPIPPPSGGKAKDGSPAGVRIYVLSCSDCGNPASHFDGWLETYDPEIRGKREALQTKYNRPLEQLPPSAWREEGLDPTVTGRQVAAVAKEPQWVDALSEDADALFEAARQKCGGEQPRECLPQ